MITAGNDLANLRNMQLRRSEAEALYREDLGRHRRTGDKGNIATLCTNLGRLLMRTSRAEDGESLLLEAEALGREIGRVMLLASVLDELASHRLAQGKSEVARKLAEEARSIRRRVGVSSHFSEALYERLGLT